MSPTFSEFLPGYEASSWYGSAPRRTHPRNIDKLNKEINAALADPKIKARFAEMGSSVARIRRRIRQLIAEETEKWGKVIRAANIKPE